MKPVCLVIGAGAGIGGTTGKRFAAEGYHAVLCRRSDEEGLNAMVADIKAQGGDATGHLLNAIEEGRQLLLLPHLLCSLDLLCDDSYRKELQLQYHQ